MTAAAGQQSEPTRARARLDWPAISYFLRHYAIAFVLIIQILVWSALSPDFLTFTNLINVARQASIVGIAAVGMTFCLIAGSIDLSVASMLAFSGMVAAITLQDTGSPLLALMVPTAVGALIGLSAGLVITRFQLSAFIVTLALQALLGAAALMLADGYTVPAQDPTFRFVGVGYIGPLPTPVWLLAAAMLTGHWVLTNTPFGRRVYAVGGNVAAARYAGVRVNQYVIAVHVLVSGAAAFAGVVLAARLGSGTPNAGSSLLLDIIAGVIIGGTSVFGGTGKMWGTLVGVLMLALLRDGLTLIDVAGYWQTMATGALLLGAVLLDRFFYAEKRD